MTQTSQRRPMLLSRRWMQVSILVFVAGFFGLGVAGYLNYTEEPPMPAKVVDDSGATLFTRSDIVAGQGVFLKNDIMEYGSVFGHGAYLGPDYTADYLHRSIASMEATAMGQPGVAAAADPAAVKPTDQAAAAVKADLRANRYDAAGSTLEFTAAQAAAFKDLNAYVHPGGRAAVAVARLEGDHWRQEGAARHR